MDSTGHQQQGQVKSLAQVERPIRVTFPAKNVEVMEVACGTVPPPHYASMSPPWCHAVWLRHVALGSRFSRDIWQMHVLAFCRGGGVFSWGATQPPSPHPPSPALTCPFRDGYQWAARSRYHRECPDTSPHQGLSHLAFLRRTTGSSGVVQNYRNCRSPGSRITRVSTKRACARSRAVEHTLPHSATTAIPLVPDPQCPMLHPPHCLYSPVVWGWNNSGQLGENLPQCSQVVGDSHCLLLLGLGDVVSRTVPTLNNECEPLEVPLVFRCIPPACPPFPGPPLVTRRKASNSCTLHTLPTLPTYGGPPTRC
jgi:hypothetical protein